MGKGGGGGTQTVIQEIPEFLETALKQTTDFARQINPAVYAGERVAGFTPLETQAQQLTVQRALSGDPTVQQAQSLLGGTLRGDYLNNPFLQQQIGSAVQGAVDKATSQYALGGRLGSAAFGSALGSGITGAAAPILSQAYEAERGRQLQAAGMAPQLAGQRFVDLAALQGVGGEQRAMQQAQLQATQDYINELNAAKMAQLTARTQAAGLGGAAGGTTTTTGGQTGPSVLGQTAGGALTGAALGSQIGSVGGPMGALIGGGLGALGLLG